MTKSLSLLVFLVFAITLSSAQASRGKHYDLPLVNITADTLSNWTGLNDSMFDGTWVDLRNVSATLRGDPNASNIFAELSFTFDAYGYKTGTINRIYEDVSIAQVTLPGQLFPELFSYNTNSSVYNVEFFLRYYSQYVAFPYLYNLTNNGTNTSMFPYPILQLPSQSTTNEKNLSVSVYNATFDGSTTTNSTNWKGKIYATFNATYRVGLIEMSTWDREVTMDVEYTDGKSVCIEHHDRAQYFDENGLSSLLTGYYYNFTRFVVEKEMNQNQTNTTSSSNGIRDSLYLNIQNLLKRFIKKF